MMRRKRRKPSRTGPILPALVFIQLLIYAFFNDHGIFKSVRIIGCFFLKKKPLRTNANEI